MTEPMTCRQISSLITEDAELQLSIVTTDVPEPAADEIVVRVEAAPINPSDLFLLFGPADMRALEVSGTGDDTVVTAPVSQQLMGSVQGRVGQATAVGNEGAGTVVKAGSSELAQSLLGTTVAMAGGEMYADYRCVKAHMAMPMPEGVTPREAASSFVNPMTVLGMVETMRDEGFTALIHTAAASNLGQMLNRLCLSEGIELVNIVRKPEQEVILRELGAKYIVNSESDSFIEDLSAAIEATGAYLAFDATGGGNLANTILTCMERSASKGKAYNRYGSDVAKKVYIYGRLDVSPMQLNVAYGFAFGVCGWLLTHFLGRVGIERMAKLQKRIASEITTTFASHYAAEISLSDALSAEAIATYGQRNTGQKYLINPAK